MGKERGYRNLGILFRIHSLGRSGKAPNALVGTGVDLPRFWDFVEENLKTLN